MWLLDSVLLGELYSLELSNDSITPRVLDAQLIPPNNQHQLNIQNPNIEDERPNGVHAINRAAFPGVKGKATKSELMKVLQIQCKTRITLVAYYVPPDRMACMDFVKDILKGRKKMIKLDSVKFVQVPEKYAELTINNLITVARAQLPQLFEYLPDNIVPAKIDREYFLNVVVIQVGDEHPRKRNH